MYHKPVLVQEVLEYLAPKPTSTYIDVTFGGGGHTRAILLSEPTCHVVAIDWDKTAIETNGPALEEEFPGRVTFIWGNFANLAHLLKKHAIKSVDGILADFGTSQFQIQEKPGFSFAQNTPLDMRMSSGHHKITAYDLVNRASESELIKIFQDYGEERFTRKIAREICEARKQRPIKTTADLVAIITRINPIRAGSIHPATRVFQALRIVVNKELENITSFLQQAVPVLKPGGRLVCISFHSLEDRIVKQFFKEHTELEILTPKIVTAQPDEIHNNSSSRSAKLRAAEKK